MKVYGRSSATRTIHTIPNYIRDLRAAAVCQTAQCCGGAFQVSDPRPSRNYFCETAFAARQTSLSEGSRGISRGPAARVDNLSRKSGMFWRLVNGVRAGLWSLFCVYPTKILDSCSLIAGIQTSALTVAQIAGPVNQAAPEARPPYLRCRSPAAGRFRASA